MTTFEEREKKRLLRQYTWNTYGDVDVQKRLRISDDDIDVILNNINEGVYTTKKQIDFHAQSSSQRRSQTMSRNSTRVRAHRRKDGSVVKAHTRKTRQKDRFPNTIIEDDITYHKYLVTKDSVWYHSLEDEEEVRLYRAKDFSLAGEGSFVIGSLLQDLVTAHKNKDYVYMHPDAKYNVKTLIEEGWETDDED